MIQIKVYLIWKTIANIRPYQANVSLQFETRKYFGANAAEYFLVSKDCVTWA